MSNEWINDCGQILLSKKNKLYLKFSKDITINKDDTLIMEKFSDSIDKKVVKGYLTEEEAEEKKEKCSFVKYVLHKAPKQS